MAHLAEEDPERRDTNEWTRVFSRDGSRGKLVGIYPLGPDLQYDKSFRDMLSQLEATAGEVVFSPFKFRKEDFNSNLHENRLPLKDLLEYGKMATKAKAHFTKHDAAGVAQG